MQNFVNDSKIHFSPAVRCDSTSNTGENTKKKLPPAVGIGLRACHYQYIETERPAVPWFEALTDNYLDPVSFDFYFLQKIAESYPITLHGVGLSLGSTDPLNETYLQQLLKLIHATNPILVSDHLSWTSFENHYFHELLPLPYTEEAVFHLAHRIQCVQDFLNRQIMVENVSTYLQFAHSTLKEWEFINAVVSEANCLILLDINNIYVSANNNNYHPMDFLNNIIHDRVAQLHLAGYTDQGSHLLDTHGASVHAPVWSLYSETIKQWGPVATSVEWDNNIPAFNELQTEAQKAQEIMDAYAKLV